MSASSLNIHTITTHLRTSPVLTTTALLTATAASLLIYDYNAWRSFGTGGTPPTWAGYWRMTKLRVSALIHRDDLTDPTPLKSDGPTYLKDTDLPPRAGPRPRIMSRTMPQRQIPVPLPDEVVTALHGLIPRLGGTHSDCLAVKPSKTEGGSTDAIYALQSLESLNPIVKESRNRILDGEVAHVHPADNSLHVWLSEGDAREVVSKGWGERFPLAFVDKGWVFVYAPRDLEELKVVEGIVKAGVRWVAGREI